MKQRPHGAGAEHPATHGPSVRASDAAKHREIRFNMTPPGQAEQAVRLLSGLESLVVCQVRQDSISVRYDLTVYTLEGLENALVAQGFHLDNSVYSKVSRALIYFCEETQLRNLRAPERLIKKSNEVYIKAWEHHSHGDHDEMPPELREYR